MKKAFSLLELIITLGLLGVIFVVFAKPLLSLNRLYANPAQSFISTSLIFAEKILQNCLEFTPNAQGFECLLKDSDNVILQRQNALFIGSAGVILRDANATFYAPKSHFSYEIQRQNGKKVQAGVAHNQKDIQGKVNSEFLYLYALKERQIHKVRVLGESKLSFEGDEFVGFYELIDGQASVELRQGDLLYHYSPYQQGIRYTSLLAQNVKDFRVEEKGDEISLTICVGENFCLTKWVRR